MSTTTITVATGKDGQPIAGIKEGKKLGYVKDTSGEFWPVEPNIVTILRSGGTFVLTYEQKTFGKLVSNAVPTEPVTPAKPYPRISPPAALSSKDMQIWINSRQLKLAELGKLDLTDEEAVVLNGEEQKRQYRRLFEAGQQEAGDLNDKIPY